MIDVALARAALRRREPPLEVEFVNQLLDTLDVPEVAQAVNAALAAALTPQRVPSSPRPTAPVRGQARTGRGRGRR